MPKKRPAAQAAMKPPAAEPSTRRGRRNLSRTDTFAAEIGRIIRETRERKGLTVEHCADAAVPTWCHFEWGRPIGLDKLPLIAVALGVKVINFIPNA